MERLASAKGFVLGATRRLIAYQVGIGAAKSRRTYSLMGIDHNLIFGSFLHGIQIMIIHPLAIVIFSTRNDVAHIATLHGIVSVVHHKLVSLVHVAFVVAHRSGGLMMHHQLHALAMRILIEHLHVKIGIRRNKIEHVVFGFSEPIFPAFIPSFHQHLVESVGGGKVDILLYMLVIGSMASVGLRLAVIQYTQLHGRQLIRISPRTLSGYQFPPDTHVLHRLNPRHIVIGARLVQVQRNAGSQYIAGVIAHNHRTPRRSARSLQIAFIAHGIRSQPRFEDKVPVVQIQVHASVIHQRRLVQVDVQPIVRLHLQSRLHTGL